MPYRKKIMNKKRTTILLIAVIAVTAAALALAVILAVFLHQKNQKAAEVAALEALPRIVVPEGHFALATDTIVVPQSSVKAVLVEAGVDFYSDPDASRESVEKEISSIVSDVKSLDFNTIYLRLGYDNKVIYRSSVFETTGVDVLTPLLAAAAEKEIAVGVIFDLQGANVVYQGQIGSQITPTAREQLALGLEEFFRRYNVSAMMLDSYYLESNGANYADYAASGYFGNYDEFLRSSIRAVFNELIADIKLSEPEMPIGLYVSDIWAKGGENGTEGGCAVAADYEALYDGNADTKAFIQEGMFDFVNVRITQSLLDPDAPFKTIADYWGDICKASSTPMYVTHAGENTVSDEKVGWNGTDELSRQVYTALKTGSYYGSIFTGLSRIVDNPEGATEYLLKYFRDEIKDDEMLSDLDITSPTKTSFVTYEEEQQFRMNFDPNAEVYLNGERVVPSERGGASVWVSLDVGVNNFVLEHKGRSVTYSIERRVIILDSISPTDNMKVGGGATIHVDVIAYKGSTITATFNGQTITLEEGGGSDEISETAYINYQGTFTAPKAQAKEQDLGRITVYGKYMGLQESKAGSNIVVDKIPDEAEPDSLTGQELQMVTVTSRYANTYPFQTTATYAEAVLYQLPQGTQDIVLSQSGDFLNLRSGKTIHSSTASVEVLPFAGNNAITDLRVSEENNDTVIRMTMNWASPFSLTPSPYPSSPITSKNSYYFAADTITLLMDYVTYVTEDADEDMSYSTLFSGMSHKLVKNEARNINQMQFTLPLARAGEYYGCSSEWEGDTLVLRFHQKPTNSLNGMVIVIDPGHGGTDNGNMAGRDVIEKHVNLTQALYLQSVLQNYGATVYMTRTNDSTMSLAQRVEFTHSVSADLFISVHHNSVGSNPVPQGPQTYFNAPFSQPLAQAIQNQLDMVMPDSGWNGWIGKNFLVCRERQYPSVLVECGFLSNPHDEALAQDDAHLWRIAEAIGAGVINYYS